MTKNRSKRRLCLLCEAKLVATSLADLWVHPPSTACGVRVTDGLGVSVDDRFEVDDNDGAIYAREVTSASAAPDVQLAAALGQAVPVDGGEVIGLSSEYVAADLVIEAIFANAGVPRLGGASGERGWSSISTFQRCPYLWKRRYMTPAAASDTRPGPEAREVGTIFHTFQAVHYQRIITPDYPLEPARLRDAMLAARAEPEHVLEAWRLYEAYHARYADDPFIPIAVEYRLADPVNGYSCRFDLLTRLDEPMAGGFLPGVYARDFKTKSRFDAAMLTSWRGDGELIGQWYLYNQLKAERRFGPLVGLCADIVGRQKEPKFERVWIVPSDTILRDHRRSLRIWSAAIDTAVATGVFPRARAACATFGLCEQFDHCTEAAS